jgi:Fe-S cluster assembly iron-binding protein IscA
MVKLGPGAGQAIKSFLAKKGLQKPLRIDLQSCGCCDPALVLSLDPIDETDEIEEVDGLTFAISPEAHRLVGSVTISCREAFGQKGFVLTSSKPLSEWDGFGVNLIRI